MIVCYLSNIFVVQTMKETEGFGILTDVFRNVVVTLNEVDTIAVVISGQGKVLLDGFHMPAVYFDIIKDDQLASIMV